MAVLPDVEALEEIMKTNRILLRPWRESDAETLFIYASDPDVGPRAGWPPHKSVEESREVIKNFFSNEDTWAIELKETSEIIGCIGVLRAGFSNLKIAENECEVGADRPVKVMKLDKMFYQPATCDTAVQRHCRGGDAIL